MHNRMYSPVRWKYWALVVPHSLAGRINMNEFVQAFYNQGVRVLVVTDPTEAMHWLETVDQA